MLIKKILTERLCKQLFDDETERLREQERGGERLRVEGQLNELIT